MTSTGAVHSWKRFGFTLIELLVVTSIMGLLISILMPSLGEVRRITKKAKCQTNLRSIGLGLQTYLNENDDYFPYAAEFPSEEENVAASEEPPRDPYLPIYDAIGNQMSHNLEVFLCPADLNTMMPELRKERYYDTEGTSYEWRSQFNGRKLGRDVLSKKKGLGLGLDGAPVMYDYEAFHGGPKRLGSHMVLYADFHVEGDTWIDYSAADKGG